MKQTHGHPGHLSSASASRAEVHRGDDHAVTRQRRRAKPLSLLAASFLILLWSGCAKDEPPPQLVDEQTQTPPPPIVESLMRGLTFTATDGDNGPFRLEDRLAFYRVPGVAVVAWNGTEVFSAGFGLSDPEAGTEMTVDTVLPAGSVLSTGVAALTVTALLSESSRNLNAPMEAQAETFGLKPELRDRTLGQLMSHTSGIGPANIDDPIADPDTFLRDLSSSRFTAGTEFRYSDTGYLVLQRYFEQTYVRSFGDLARSRLFEPLALASSDFGAEAAGSALYDRRGRAVDTTPVAPAVDGLRASASDLARLLQAVQAIRRRDLENPPITPKQLGFVTTPRLGGWSMGWRLVGPSRRPTAIVAYGEDQPHFALAFLDRPAGVVITTNSADDGRLAREVALAAARRFNWEYPVPERGTNPTPGFDALPKLVGGYELAGRRFDIEWTLGRLMLQPGEAFPELGTEALPMLGTRTDHWILQQAPMTIQFRRGNPVAVAIDGRLAVKVAEPAEPVEMNFE